MPESKVALSTCDGIHGIIYIGDETYFIHPKDDAQLDGHHLILNQKSLEQNKTHVPHELLFAKNQIEENIQRRVIAINCVTIVGRKLIFFFFLILFADKTISKE